MHDRFLYSFTDYGDMQTEPHFELIWSLCRKFSYIYIYIYIYIFQADDDNYFFFFSFFFFFFFKLRSSKLKSQFHHAPTVFNTQRELLKSKCCRKIKWLRATYRYQSYHQFPQPAFTIRHPLLVPELEYTQNETSSLAQNETYFLFIIARTTVEA